MIDLKPYGAFIENTIRPLLLEVERICDKHEFDASQWKFTVLAIGVFHILQTIIKTAGEIACVAIGVWFLCKTLA